MGGRGERDAFFGHAVDACTHGVNKTSTTTYARRGGRDEHLRLHRSVTEIRRYVCCRPNPSVKNSENGFACIFSCSILDNTGALDAGDSGSSLSSTWSAAVARVAMCRCR